MAYRQSRSSWMQQQTAPPPPQQQQQRDTSTYAPGGSRSPPPAPLDTQQSHARYSSADLYALQHSPTLYPQRPSVDAGQRLTRDVDSRHRRADSEHDSDDDDDDDDDEDDGPGFASHGDLAHRQQKRTSSMQQLEQMRAQQPQSHQYHQYQPPTLQQQYQQPYFQPHQQPQQRMSMPPLPPPFVSHPSRMTTKSAFDFTLTDPTAAGAGAAGSASTSKLAVGDDYIDAPILSKKDWKRGEPIKEKHNHDAEKQRRKRDRVKGEVMDVGFGIGEFVKRNWKWIVPLLVFLSVAAILLCYFLIPRTPTITFDSPKVPSPAFFANANANANDSAAYISSADPTAFSFQASIAFAIDASASYLAVNYHSFDLTVRLQETGGIVAQQSYGSGEISVPARRVTSYEFPITFAGNYTNANNPTYAAIRSACAHKYATIYRPPLNLTVSVSSSIVGVVNSPTRIARLDAVDCPVEWLKTAS